jgi:hypothetical protein
MTRARRGTPDAADPQAPTEPAPADAEERPNHEPPPDVVMDFAAPIPKTTPSLVFCCTFAGPLVVGTKPFTNHRQPKEAVGFGDGIVKMRIEDRDVFVPIGSIRCYWFEPVR